MTGPLMQMLHASFLKNPTYHTVRRRTCSARASEESDALHLAHTTPHNTEEQNPSLSVSNNTQLSQM